MIIPNPNTENIYVFDNYEKFAEAVERFARGVNVFWKSGTTYDMMTSYAGGALVGAKYTVDEDGASETPGGGGYDIVITKNGTEGAAVLEKGTYAEFYNKLHGGEPVTAVYKLIDADGIEQRIVPLSSFYFYVSSGDILAYGAYAYRNDLYVVEVDITPQNVVGVYTVVK